MNNTETEKIEETSEQVRLLKDSIDLILQNMELTVERVATEEGMNNPIDYKVELLKEFKQTTESNPTIYSMRMGLEQNGGMITYPYTDMGSDYDSRKNDWYMLAMEQPSELIWTDPYLDTRTEEMVVTLAKAIPGQGVLAIDIFLDTLTALVNEIKISDTGYIFLVDKNGLYITNPTFEKVATDFKQEELYGKLKNDEGSLTATYENKERLVGYATSELTGWKVIGLTEAEEIKKSAEEIIVPLMIGTLIIIVVASFLSVFVSLYITKPIKRLRNVVQEMSKGDFTVQASIARKDEIGELAEGFNHMVNEMNQTLQKVQTISAEVADASSMLTASAEENSAASHEVATTIEQIANGASEQSELTQANRRELITISERIEHIDQLSEKISEDSLEMSKASEIGKETVQKLKNQFDSTVQNAQTMSKAVNQLDSSSRDINDIVSTINNIAGQTNLLALNAAIEAARAGDHGRGFAVVADEVRRLADQTDESTKKISHIIQTMQNDTSLTVQLIEETNQQIHNQEQVVENTETAFITIAAFIQELMEQFSLMKTGLQEVTNKLQGILLDSEHVSNISEETAAGTEQVAASIEQTTASMEQLNQLAFDLEQLSKGLSEEIYKFKI